MVPPVLRFRAQFRRLDTIKQVCLVLLVAVLVLAVSIPYIIRITPNIYRPLPKLNAALVNRVDTVVSRPRFPCEDKHAIRETAELIMLVNCTDFCKTDSTVQAVLKTMVKKPALVLKSLPTWPTESYNSTDFHTAARNLLHEHVKIFTDVQFFNESDALKVMWGQGTEQDLQHVEYASAVLRSLSLLMLQPEYILSQALKDRGIFPTIYGTCGEFYLQESCPPRNGSWSPPELLHLGKREAFWIGRARDALNILRLPDLLHKGLPDSLLACDFKNENVGVCEDGSIRVIDSNNLFFKSMFASLAPCQRDNECWIINCYGKCNNATRRCQMDYDLNLQYICRRHFKRSARQLSLDPPPAVAEDLLHVLQECINLLHLLHHESGAGDRVLKELTSILNRSLLLHQLY